MDENRMNENNLSEEEVTAESRPAEERKAEPQTPPQWQGAYSYQNPNPYQNYQYYYQPQPPKKKNRSMPFVIAAATAGVMMALCCLVIFGAVIRDVLADWKQKLPERPSFQWEEKEEEKKEPVEDSKRDESAVYDVPDITTEKKSGEELSLNEIYKKVKDSVVAILISEDGIKESVFSGSGFIISADGYIISNHHVIDKGKTVKVILSDGITEYTATVVGSDEQSDLAVLKVNASNLIPAELGDSDELEVGETVAAIGNPYGMELFSTMHNGIVSALNRKLEIGGTFMTLIQTNALINPGNSGGPLVNAYGQVVGITSSKLVANGYEGIGFAIPLNEVTGLIEELVNYGYVKTRGYIGIYCEDVTDAYASFHGLPQGVYVESVEPESDAAKQGLKKGDIITAFAGEKITSVAELTAVKDSYHPGDQVTIKVWREKKEFEITITLTEAFD